MKGPFIGLKSFLSNIKQKKMAQIVNVGRKSTIIEGSESEINEIRQKLHDLGFNFDNCQYIELKEVSNAYSPQPQPSPAPQKAPEPQKSSAPQQSPAPQKAPEPQKNSAPQETSTPQSSSQESSFPYKITPINNGYSILIPQSKLDAVTSLFHQKKRLKKDDPNDKNISYFFAFKPPNIEFSVYPNDSPDENHKIEVALKLLSLI